MEYAGTLGPLAVSHAEPSLPAGHGVHCRPFWYVCVGHATHEVPLTGMKPAAHAVQVVRGRDAVTERTAHWLQTVTLTPPGEIEAGAQAEDWARLGTEYRVLY